MSFLGKATETRKGRSVRLTPSEIAAIKETAERHFGAATSVWLFGSRLDDQRRGGDIDLLLDTDLRDADAAVRAETAFLLELKRRIGERKIDLLVDFPSRTSHAPVFRIARDQGVRL